ncbi:MAG: cytochrome b [Alphaproteobacteria bacterium]
MMLRNRSSGYGVVSRVLHWLMAFAIPAMFALGLWMSSLDYYSPYYKSAPDLHKSIGLMLLALLVLRFIWRQFNVKPDNSHLSSFEQLASIVVHLGLYGLLLALFVSGYLISTADGRPIEIFGMISVPATLQLPHQEDIAGEVHELLANVVIGLSVVHAMVALKHHYINRDRTLGRMWFGS